MQLGLRPAHWTVGERVQDSVEKGCVKRYTRMDLFEKEEMWLRSLLYDQNLTQVASRDPTHFFLAVAFAAFCFAIFCPCNAMHLHSWLDISGTT